MLHMKSFVNRVSTSSLISLHIKVVSESQAFSFPVFPEACALLNKNGESTECYSILRVITKPTHKMPVAIIKDSW